MPGEGEGDADGQTDGEDSLQQKGHSQHGGALYQRSAFGQQRRQVADFVLRLVEPLLILAQHAPIRLLTNS